LSGSKGATTVPRALAPALFAWALPACNAPTTHVVLDNDYPADAGTPLVVYRAFWQAVAFQDPVLPGESSSSLETVPASANIAYVVLAPGFDPTGDAGPTSFVLLESRDAGFGVNLNETLHIPVDDTRFAGNCDAGSSLSQAQADFIVNFVFTPNLFPDAAAPFRYNAATCTTIPTP
jgi:hypothetical protein